MLKVDIDEIKLTDKTSLLKDIHFEVSSNKVYTILGENGSGKSTLTKALTKLLNPNLYSVEGKVLINEIDVYNSDLENLIKIRKEKISYVFQDAINSFDPLKKLNYYFDKISKEKNIDELLEYFILPKYEELKKLYAYELSGGMAQRVSFVLALSSHPQIIIMDEPTSGIDPAIANLFLLKIKEFAGQKNNSVLLVTHDLLFAEKVSDKIALLKNGTLSEFILKEDFFNNKKDVNQLKMINTYSELTK